MLENENATGVIRQSRCNSEMIQHVTEAGLGGRELRMQRTAKVYYYQGGSQEIKYQGGDR